MKVIPIRKDVHYSHEEIVKRFQEWQQLFDAVSSGSMTDQSLYARRRAWCRYCEARDGVYEGKYAP